MKRALDVPSWCLGRAGALAAAGLTCIPARWLSAAERGKASLVDIFAMDIASGMRCMPCDVSRVHAVSACAGLGDELSVGVTRTGGIA